MLMRWCMDVWHLLVQVNARVRRIPKAVQVIVPVNDHYHTNLEQGGHREWPVEPCGVLGWEVVVVYAGGMWWWWWCMVGFLPATHTPSFELQSR